MHNMKSIETKASSRLKPNSLVAFFFKPETSMRPNANISKRLKHVNANATIFE